MLKKLFDKLLPDSACEGAIIEMSLHRLRTAQESLREALRADKLEDAKFDVLRNEAVACVVNVSKAAIDLAGPGARRKPRFETILSGVYFGCFAVGLGFAASDAQKNQIRRCVHHLAQSMEASRGIPKPGNLQDQSIVMIANLVATSIFELGLEGQDEGSSCEAVLTSLTRGQFQHSLSHIM